MKRLPDIVSALFAVALSLEAWGTARAVTQVPEGTAAGGKRLAVDVWMNKEEGGVYRPGESMRIFFRSNADAYVLVYNIDTDGYIHLVFPYGPADPPRVEGGRTYRIPARHDPYDLVADGPPGMEFVVAVASPLPFHDLPWYLTSGAPEVDPEQGAGTEGNPESGSIVGDPYVGMEHLNRRIIPAGHEGDADASETYFYIDQRVEYPRYVCADCHYSAFGFDPYVNLCPVVDIRIDATWVRYAPVHVRVARPRYYYWVRPSAPDRYRAWKGRWSSLDGVPTLRSKFTVVRTDKSVRMRELKSRSLPPEFRDLRRNRPGRLWQGRDEVLRLWERQHGGTSVKPPTKSEARSRREGDASQQHGRSEARDGQGGGKPPETSKGGEKSRERERSEPQAKDGGKDRGHVQDQKERTPPTKREEGPPPKNDVERRERNR